MLTQLLEGEGGETLHTIAVYVQLLDAVVLFLKSKGWKGLAAQYSLNNQGF